MFKTGQRVRIKESTTPKMINEAILLPTHLHATGVIVDKPPDHANDIRVRVLFDGNDPTPWYVPWILLELLQPICMFGGDT